jgi:transcription-repair coupling factor (superfamily II helicase)
VCSSDLKQKEKFKKLSEKLNVLILSATPIPRTLYFSLSGIRDISEINTPPRGRKSIETKIAKFNDSDIVEFADRELKRGGQIYYLHNRVETIIPTREKLQRMLPKAKIQIAHGQMSEEDLANTMAEFAKGDVDILVCSTIIENGLDLPNVNTLIIEEADRFGLSQLYQIRGRIGRSDRQAYSLFTYKKELSVNAFKRLQSLAENTELGSGFNIAMSDLEIRGGGNILGREQHGNMEAVGLVLYSKLLKQAVLKIES